MINPFGGGTQKSPTPADVRLSNLVGVYAMTETGDFNKINVPAMFGIEVEDAAKYLYVIEVVGGGESGSSFADGQSTTSGHITSTGGRGGGVYRSQPFLWSELSDGWVVIGAGGQAANYWNGFVNPGGSTFYLALPDDVLATYTGGIPDWDPSVLSVYLQSSPPQGTPQQILPQLDPMPSHAPSSAPGITSTVFGGLPGSGAYGAPGPYTTPMSIYGESSSESLGPGSGAAGGIGNVDEMIPGGFSGGSGGVANAHIYMTQTGADETPFGPFYGGGGNGGNGGVGNVSPGTNGYFPGGGGGGAGWDLSDTGCLGGNGADGVFRVYVYRM